MKSVKR